MKWPSVTRRRLLITALFGLGVAILATGIYLETQNPRTELQDDDAWCVAGLGTSLIGAGIGLRAGGWGRPLQFAFVAPPVGYLGAVAAFWGFMVLYVLLR
ncbi:MAG TPA: hypothetical protein VGN12_26025 [Pirellulales bacterium]|jgi:hypothetical protein